LSKCKNMISVEQNYTGQMVGVIAENTGIIIENHIRNYSGRPSVADDVVEETKKILGKV